MAPTEFPQNSSFCPAPHLCHDASRENSPGCLDIKIQAKFIPLQQHTFYCVADARAGILEGILASGVEFLQQLSLRSS